MLLYLHGKFIIGMSRLCLSSEQWTVPVWSPHSLLMKLTNLISFFPLTQRSFLDALTTIGPLRSKQNCIEHIKCSTGAVGISKWKVHHTQHAFGIRQPALRAVIVPDTATTPGCPAYSCHRPLVDVMISLSNQIQQHAGIYSDISPAAFSFTGKKWTLLSTIS